MARVVKDYDVRRSEILDTAQTLFYSVGYEQTTVNMIIAETGIAKGTFYHYFRSKTDLVDGLVDRLSGEITRMIKPGLESDLTAVEKFRHLYRTASSIKLSNIELMIPLMKVIYDEKNLVFRHRMFARQRPWVVSLYTTIVRQGAIEQSFSISDPQQTAEILVDLWFSMGEPIARLMIHLPDERDNLMLIRDKLLFYENAVERLLGAAEGSLELAESSGMWKALKDVETKMREAEGDDR